MNHNLKLKPFNVGKVYVEAKKHLRHAQAKPPRIKPNCDKEHLKIIANRPVKANQGQIFYNPSIYQLDRIFKGSLYGH